MNVTINSQVQSPFVRTLEAVPTKGGSFTHHIPDNVPPVSISKVPVLPVNPATTYGASETITFPIPQYGYLTKCVLKAKVKYTVALTGNTGSTTYTPPVIASDGALSMITAISLNTRNRPIEKRYGPQMYADILSGDDSERRRKLEMLNWHYDTVSVPSATTELLPGRSVSSDTDFAVTEATIDNQASMFPGAAVTDFAAVQTISGTYDSYLELPFSSFDTLASNLNTRFVEPCSVKIDLRNFAVAGDSFRVRDLALGAGVVTGAAGTTGGWTIEDVSLQCHFLNYHDLTEQDIRDANFKPDAPAVVFSTDVREETCKTVAVSEGAAVKDTVDIRSNNIAKEILVLYTPTVHMTTNVDLGVSRHNQFLCVDEIKLSGSGQDLYKGSSVENILVDRYDHPLSTWSNKLYNSYGLNERRGLDGVHMIQFGLSRNPTYNSGCLGLQTVSNPQITVTRNGAVNASPAGELRVYVKHHSLVQIDSGTGAVTRSIDA